MIKVCKAGLDVQEFPGRVQVSPAGSRHQISVCFSSSWRISRNNSGEDGLRIGLKSISCNTDSILCTSSNIVLWVNNFVFDTYAASSWWVVSTIGIATRIQNGTKQIKSDRWGWEASQSRDFRSPQSEIWRLILKFWSLPFHWSQVHQKSPFLPCTLHFWTSHLHELR